MMVEDEVTRRRFLATGGVLAAGMVASGCAAAMVYNTVARNGLVTVVIADFPDLATPGGGIQLQAQGFSDRIILVNLDGEVFRALSGVCTHLRCNVRYAGKFLQCPCHGSTFDLEGKAVRGPAQRGLRVFETRVLNGKIEIRL